MTSTDTFADRSAQHDRDTITKARAVAAAKTIADLRAAITDAYPIHADYLAGMDDGLAYVYVSGVMAEVIRELANLAEREINRNA
jgi:hypothetical protein